MHNPFIGEVPFPLMGEGISLRLRTGDLVRLRSKYGSPPTAKPEFDETGKRIDYFWELLFRGVESHDPVVMVDVLKAALKTNEGRTPLLADFEDLPFSLSDAVFPLMDAISVSRWGKTVAQVEEEFREKLAAAEAAVEEGGNPLTGLGMDGTNSTASSGPDTDQGSTQTSAGS
jgi:hypothetical protein